MEVKVFAKELAKRVIEQHYEIQALKRQIDDYCKQNTKLQTEIEEYKKSYSKQTDSWIELLSKITKLKNS